MLYLISGAVASGKTTIGRTLAERMDLAFLEEDVRPGADGTDRLNNLEHFLQDAIELEAQGKDVVFGSQAPLGEVLASPPAVELEGIAPCLLDAHDFVRLERWIARGVDPRWPVGMDHFCWAVFHRLHARDPQYEQRVLLDREHDRSIWTRWSDWSRLDSRWDVLICDTTALDVSKTVARLSDWVSAVRDRGAPLMKDAQWWS